MSRTYELQSPSGAFLFVTLVGERRVLMKLERLQSPSGAFLFVTSSGTRLRSSSQTTTLQSPSGAFLFVTNEHYPEAEVPENGVAIP